jgi:hypothetical protein
MRFHADEIRVGEPFPKEVMRVMEQAGGNFPPASTRGYQLSIVTQLLQVIATMRHPGELFQWLASVIVQRFDVSIIQFWTCESDSSQLSAQLWAVAGQEPDLPAHVLTSEKVVMTVEYMPRGQRVSPPQRVEQVFPNYQASLLKRYGFSYCAYCLTDRKVQFAPVEYELSHKRASTGLAFIALLFLRRYPRQDLVPTISNILEQTVVIAESHGLLLPIAASTDRLFPPSGRQPGGPVSNAPQVAARAGPLPQELLQALPNLIPHPKQDARLLVSSNPFASAPPISDKQALRLYSVIDGRKTVAELCASTGMTLREVHTVLQTLLALQRIEIYTSDGRPVDGSLLFKDR